MQLKKQCVLCNKTFSKPVWISLKNWNEIRKYCSRKCLNKSKVGNTYRRGKKHPNIWNKGKIGIMPVPWNKGKGEYAKQLGFGKWMTGKKHTERTKLKMSLSHSEDKSASWKGDNVSYGGLHMWVYKHLGKPDTCEHCGVRGLKGHQIHWANKSGKYKRNIKDWLRLCVKCHVAYDKKYAIKYRISIFPRTSPNR